MWGDFAVWSINGDIISIKPVLNYKNNDFSGRLLLQFTPCQEDACSLWGDAIKSQKLSLVVVQSQEPRNNPHARPFPIKPTGP